MKNKNQLKKIKIAIRPKLTLIQKDLIILMQNQILKISKSLIHPLRNRKILNRLRINQKTKTIVLQLKKLKLIIQI